MDPAPTSKKDIMENDIKKECQIILEKYFEKREYDKEKVEKWKNYSLKDIYDYLEKKYNDFGFIIAIIVKKKGNSRTDSRIICRNNTDDFICVNVVSETMFCEIRVYFYKLHNSKISLLDFIEENIILEMNSILTKNLEKKNYTYESAKESVKNIVNELNDYLLKKSVKRRPYSSNICYILEKPMEFIFNYKIIRLKYIPLITSYSNDSLYSLLILILLEN